MKGDFISNEPLVQSHDLTQCGDAPFLVAGSDGVFGEMSDQQVVETVARMREERNATAQAIVDTIVRGIGGLEYSDNVSCIVVFFAKGTSQRSSLPRQQEEKNSTDALGSAAQAPHLPSAESAWQHLQPAAAPPSAPPSATPSTPRSPSAGMLSSSSSSSLSLSPRQMQ